MTAAELAQLIGGAVGAVSVVAIVAIVAIVRIRAAGSRRRSEDDE